MNYTPTFSSQPSLYVPQMDRPLFLKSIRDQVETLFSIECLAQTPYLVSLMNDNGSVAIQQVITVFFSAFPSATVEDIIEAVQNSDIVVVDKSFMLIRPNITVERKTIIIRDVPESTTEEELRGLFSDVSKVESVKPSIGNNWFVTMVSESLAIESLKAIQNIPFKETIIHARIKNESILLAINRQINALLPSYTDFYSQQQGYSAYQSSSVFSSATMADTSSLEVEHSSLRSFDQKPRRGRGGKMNREFRQTPVSKPITLPQIDNQHRFPPLIFTGSMKSSNEVSMKRYSVNDIMAIVRNMTDLSLPSLPEDDFSLVLTEEANADLAQKQRTKSIDQSLESGMPRSYSIDSVDYTTMLMGDVDEEVKQEARKRRNMKPRKLDYSKLVTKSVREEVKKEETKFVREEVKKVETKSVREEVKKVETKREEFKREETKRPRYDSRKNHRFVEKPREGKKKDEDEDGWTIV